MKFLKLGQIASWDLVSGYTFEGRSGHWTGVKVTVLSEVDNICQVNDETTVDKDGKATPRPIFINAGEMTEISVSLKGGGSLVFDENIMARTQNNRSVAHVTHEPTFVRPPRERRRDPQAELLDYQRKRNEERRLEAKFEKYEAQIAKLEELEARKAVRDAEAAKKAEAKAKADKLKAAKELIAAEEKAIADAKAEKEDESAE